MILVYHDPAIVAFQCEQLHICALWISFRMSSSAVFLVGCISLDEIET